MRENEAAVLKVALAPAAVADQLINEGWRCFFPRSVKFIGQPHAISGLAHQGGFHKIVTQDFSAQRPLARQARQLAVRHERFYADDGVMPPVLSFAKLPVMQTRREDRPVKMIGELLNAGNERAAVHRFGRRLKDADGGMKLHGLYHADHGGAAHQAVRIIDDHIAVVCAPAAAEIGNVPAFAAEIAPAPPVEHLTEGFFLPAEFVPGFFLRYP